jgi:hypothetical protein
VFKCLVEIIISLSLVVFPLQKLLVKSHFFIFFPVNSKIALAKL